MKEFILNFKEWQKIKLEPFNLNVESEISKILSLATKPEKMELENYILNLYERFLKDGFISLKHPFSGKTCYALANYSPNDNFLGQKRDAWLNFLLFADENYENPFLLMQICHFFDFVITKESAFVFGKGAFVPFFSQISRVYEWLNELDLNGFFSRELKLSDLKWNFTLEQYRPMHFFYEILSNFYKIHKISGQILKIYPKKSFIKPDFIVESDDKISIRPNIFPDIKGEIFKEVLDENLANFNDLIDKIDSFDNLFFKQI